MTFSQENTSGYTDDQLATLNHEWDAIVATEGLTEEMPEWQHAQERLLVDFDQRFPAEKKHDLSVDDRVEGGERGTEDHDTGRVTAVHVDGQVTVAWDSQVQTTQSAELLRRI